MTTTYIPPLSVSRMIGTYHFEGQGYVAIVADGHVPTELLIEKAQALLDLKREELAASAGEAGTAETVQQGSVHEHAVPEGQTPDPDLNRGGSHDTR